MNIGIYLCFCENVNVYQGFSKMYNDYADLSRYVIKFGCNMTI